MKILVTNSHSVRNAGDRVLLEVTLAELQANFPGSEITVAINSLLGVEDCDTTRYVGSFMNWFKSVDAEAERWDRRRLLALPLWMLQAWLVGLAVRYLGRPWPAPRDAARRALLDAYVRADLLVSSPGNFFYSGSGLGVAFLLHVCALAYGALLGKPLYMMPQTIGPLSRRRERWALAPILKRMRFVTLRDEKSLPAVLALGVPAGRCRVVPDSAFLFEGDGESRRFTALIEEGGPREPDRPYLGVTVIDWGVKNRRFTRQAEYERAVSEAASAFLAQHGGTVFIFPQVTGPSALDDDRIPARRVAAALDAAGAPAVLVDAVWPPGELRAAYGRMDLFLGTRLHSNIFALTAGTPVLAVAYQYKTHGVLAMLGLGEWVIDIEDVDAAGLAGRLELLWQQRAEVKALIRDRLPALQHEARRAAMWIAADYAQLAAANGRGHDDGRQR